MSYIHRTDQFRNSSFMNSKTWLCAVVIASWPALASSAFADWQIGVVPAPGPVIALDRLGAEIRVAVGKSWYRLKPDATGLQEAGPLVRPSAPAGAMPDARVAVGVGSVARAWLSDPTERYRHGVLGDAIEAGSLTIERRDGQRSTVKAGEDAVFEDIEPRIVEIGGAERVILVKSYLARGSALALIDPESGTVLAETPPIGHPRAWLNPAGVADFDGDGTTDIAFVRQPHVVGALELWSWRDNRLQKTAEVSGVANHFIGSRFLDMSLVADFDGDGRPDLAVPDLERRTLRLIGFVPRPHDIARVALPARIAGNIGAVKLGNRTALLFALDDGRLVLARN